MSKEYVVKGKYELDKFTQVCPGSATPDTGMQMVEITGPVKIDGGEVLINTLLWFQTGCSMSGFTFVFGVGFIMASKAAATKVMKMKPIMAEDEGNCMGVFINNTTGIPLPCSCTAKFKKPGQTVAHEL